ncbi:conserved hypothetical protein [Burkholderia latens]|uniref:hypothetical protein n=1 Tax=Burkholderia latens TaxID=488446 RepID=UPI0039A4F436
MNSGEANYQNSYSGAVKEPILSREQVLKIVRKTLKENNDRDKLSSDRFVALAAALESALLEKLCGEPVGYRHVMHMEGGQTQTRLTEDAEDHFGVPGEDYDETYTVTTDPVYALNRSKA